MDGEYKYAKFEKDLNNGYQIYLTYVNNRYLIYKTTTNCYTQELLEYDEKNPQPRVSMITKKRLREIFKYSTDIEYKIMY